LSWRHHQRFQRDFSETNFCEPSPTIDVRVVALLQLFCQQLHLSINPSIIPLVIGLICQAGAPTAVDGGTHGLNRQGQHNFFCDVASLLELTDTEISVQ